MNKQAFLNHLEELLELEAGVLKGDESLGALAGWDSLAVVSFIAMVDEHYGKNILPEKLETAQTVADLMRLVFE